MNSGASGSALIRRTLYQAIQPGMTQHDVSNLISQGVNAIVQTINSAITGSAGVAP